MDSDVNCPIKGLLKTRFSQRPFEERKKIVLNGKPVPKFKFLKTYKKQSISLLKTKYNYSVYEKTKWITGSTKLNKLFCWPCLLFSNYLNIWNDHGLSNLNYIYSCIQKHERSQSHIEACQDLNTFEDNVKFKLSGEKNLHNQLCNERVNRNILKKLIDIVIYLGSKEQRTFTNNNVSTESPKHEQRSSLINLLYRYDKLNNHSSATVNSNLSNRIENDLIDSIGIVVLNKIYAEVEDSKFVSIILDETSDFTNVSQLSTIVRYVVNNKVVERFLGFANVRKNRSTTDLYDHVCKVIRSLNCENKLICQTYGTAATFSSHLNELQGRVRYGYPTAIFFSCCTHVLDLVISQACASIKSCSIFFSTLKNLQLFLNNSAKRTSAFEDMIKKHLPRASPAHWSSLYQLVNGTRVNRINLISLFENIIEQPDNWDNVTVDAALGFKYKLLNIDFIFSLEVFNDVFIHIDTLDSILQSEQIDVMRFLQEVTKTLTVLKEQKNKDYSFYKIYKLIVIQSDNKRLLETHEEEIFARYKSLYHEIFDTISEHFQIRFRSLGELQFLELLNSCKFEQYSRNFPQNAFCSFKNVYHEYFAINQLQKELSAIYTREDIWNLCVTEIMDYIVKGQLIEYLPELYKLCTLIVTIPTSTRSVERSFFTLKGIKLLQKDETEKRMSNLALMSIESELLASMQNSEKFYNDVINEFRSKEGKMEPICK